MKQLYFSTKKLTILGVLAMIAFAGCAFLPPLHDHALFFTGSTPPDTAIFCGFESDLPENLRVNPTLYVSATASDAAGAFRMTFRDGSSMRFNVPAGLTYSITYRLGGPVKITAEGGVRSMMASIEVSNYNFRDPFNETLDGASSQLYNFCVTAPSEPGSTSAARIIP